MAVAEIQYLCILIVWYYLVTSVAYRRTHLLRRHCNCQYKPTPALLLLLTGSARRVVHGEIGCSKWKKTLAYLLVLPGSRARIVRCGGRYDPQLVTRCRILNLSTLRSIDQAGPHVNCKVGHFRERSSNFDQTSSLTPPV